MVCGMRLSLGSVLQRSHQHPPPHHPHHHHPPASRPATIATASRHQLLLLHLLVPPLLLLLLLRVSPLDASPAQPRDVGSPNGGRDMEPGSRGEQLAAPAEETRLKVVSREAVSLANEGRGWVLEARGSALEPRRYQPYAPQSLGSVATLYRYKSSNPVAGGEFVSLGFGGRMLTATTRDHTPSLSLTDELGREPSSVSSHDAAWWRCVFVRRGQRDGTELESAAFRGEFLTVSASGLVALRPHGRGTAPCAGPSVESATAAPDEGCCLFDIIAAKG